MPVSTLDTISSSVAHFRGIALGSSPPHAGLPTQQMVTDPHRVDGDPFDVDDKSQDENCKSHTAPSPAFTSDKLPRDPLVTSSQGQSKFSKWPLLYACPTTAQFSFFLNAGLNRLLLKLCRVNIFLALSFVNLQLPHQRSELSCPPTPPHLCPHLIQPDASKEGQIQAQ